MQHIKEYIKEHYKGNKSEFARMQGVYPQHVIYWCKGEYYVSNGRLFHLTRDLKGKVEFL